MRTRSSQRGSSVAMVGWSPDGDVSPSGGKGGGGTPGVPTPPGVPSPPSGARAGSPSGLPPQLAALVDASGMSSISRSNGHGDAVSSVGTSRLHDLSLLGGLITADSVTVTTSSTSDGNHATSHAASRVVGLEFAGHPISVTGDGVSAGGRSAPIPGLPDQPAQALKKLGISFRLPTGHRSVRGSNGAATMQGLQVVINTGPLRSKLNGLPLNELVNQVPNQTGELKTLLGALVNLSPKFVITTGTTAANVDTVPKIAIPSLSAQSVGPAAGPAATGTAGSGGTTLGAAGTGGPGAGAPVTSVPGSGSGTAQIAPRSARPGLPPLGSVPGVLIAGGLLIASALGWWLQKIGGFVLGGAGSCSHGLETGVPDLRKAR
jgi:hypothetical protein